jgi:hypothetical protein
VRLHLGDVFNGVEDLKLPFIAKVTLQSFENFKSLNF